MTQIKKLSIFVKYEIRIALYIVLYNLNIINSFLCFTISIHIQIEMTFREIKLTIMYFLPPRPP